MDARFDGYAADFSYFPSSSFSPASEGAAGFSPECDEPPPSGVRLRAKPTVALSSPCSDAELAVAAAAGDTVAARAIWQRYAVVVRSRLRRSLGSVDIDDLVQDVFLRLFSRLSDLRNPEALRSYIIGITIHVGGSALRRKRLRWWLTLTATGELPEAHAEAGSTDEQREALDRFAALMDKLHPRSRRAFELRYVDELRLTEVAEALDVSLATAKRHLARASSRVFTMVERDPLLSEYMGNEMLREEAS